MIVDDQLSFLIGRGVVEAPEPDARLVTTYAFQLRLASSLLVERATEGVLRSLAGGMGTAGLEAVISGFSGRVDVLDPTSMAAEIARAKAELRCNLLAAEVVAAARRTDSQVRLSPGNATGRLVDVLLAAAIEVKQWNLREEAAGLVIVESDVSGRPGR